MRHIDLTKVNSMTIGKLIAENYDTLMSASSKDLLVGSLETMLADAKLNTEASRKMIFHLKSTSTLPAAQQIVVNYFMAAKGLATRRKQRYA